MCEMLANQYFMTRKFEEALNIYKKIFTGEPSQINVQAKMIICLTVEGRLNDALYYLFDALNKNPDFFINKCFETQICPCKQLIEKAERDLLETNSYRKQLVLGILWSYCSFDKSLENFNQAYSLEKDQEVSKLISILSKIIITKIKNQKMELK